MKHNYRALILLTIFVLFFAANVCAQPGDYEKKWREKRIARLQEIRKELRLVNAALAREPNSATLYNQRGLLRSETSDEQGALQDFTRAIEIFARAEFYVSRGAIYERRWRSESAESGIGLSHSDLPQNVLRQRLIENYVTEPNFAAAEKDYQTAHELDKTLDSAKSALNNLSHSRTYYVAQNEKNAKAIAGDRAEQIILADFDRMLAYYATTDQSMTRWFLLSTWLNKGIAFDYFGKDAEALAAYDKAEQYFGEYDLEICQTAARRAAIFIRQKEFRLAVGALTNGINAPHNNCRRLLENRADVYSELSEWQLAVNDYNRLADFNRGFMQTRFAYKRGKVWLELGEAEKAAEDFTRAINQHTLCEKEYRQRARAYRMLGKNDLADADDKAALKAIEQQAEYPGQDYCYGTN